MPKRAAAALAGVEEDAGFAEELPLPLPELAVPLPLPPLLPLPLPLPDVALGAEPGGIESVPFPLGPPVAVALPEPAEPVAMSMPVVPEEPPVRIRGTPAEPVPDALLVVEAEEEEEEVVEHEVEFSDHGISAVYLRVSRCNPPIVTPAPLHTLAKALSAAAALLEQFLQMDSTTAVALLPLQTA
ncbi:hypothetical protein LTR94_014151 [Friedmanniomyces endolithicus]|nr:hypothetical protein LTR94_014151 [Friedmanniomyces endolithicus]